MADVHDKRTRSRNMAAIKGSGTKPEIMVRKALFKRGFRYRLNIPDLPGKPDIVLPKYKTCIFINGCFWHMHANCPMFVLPKTRIEFWKNKLSTNVKRDYDTHSQLIKSGWKVIVVWECTLKGRAALQIETVADRLSYLITISSFSNNPLVIE